MKIHLPNSAFLGNIDPFLREYDPTNPDTLEITANEKWISIHPVALAMVAARGLQVAPEHITCQPLTAKSKHYLERMCLFKLLRVESDMTVTEHEPAGRFIPLTQVIDSEQLSQFITEMIPLLHLSPRHAEPIKYVVSELIRNVIEHSLSENGAIVAAQYYKKSNTIRIGIADTGIGIRESINQSYNTKNDLEAIQLALTPGVTGTTRKEGGTEFNAGAGLFFIKSIAKVNKTFFVVYSGNTMYKLLKPRGKKMVLYADPLKDRHSIAADLSFWQGTIVGIDIDLDETEEFSSLLDLIRPVYIETIKERKKQKHRRPRFT